MRNDAPQNAADFNGQYRPDYDYNDDYDEIEDAPPVKDRYWLHALLFVLAIITTTLAGAELVTNKRLFLSFFGVEGRAVGWEDVRYGVQYSLAFIGFLTFHEFGHYFAAVYHRVRSSLPYYIPVYIPFFLNIGSMGAVIRIRQTPQTTAKYFDIGIAGPLAGFVFSLFLLTWGFTHLPEPDYVMQFNPDYMAQFGGPPTEEQLIETHGDTGLLRIGDSLLFWFFEEFVAEPGREPNHFEIVHYPLLFVGFLTLFFTALNLMPIGQLDGGHVTYGLFGRKRANVISKAAAFVLIIYGGTGILHLPYDTIYYYVIGVSVYLLYLFFVISAVLDDKRVSVLGSAICGVLIVQEGIFYGSAWLFDYQWQDPVFLWLVYALLVSRVLGLDHPPARLEHRLDWKRKALGWLAILIFIVSISPAPVESVYKRDVPPDEKPKFTVR